MLATKHHKLAVNCLWTIFPMLIFGVALGLILTCSSSPSRESNEFPMPSAPTNPGSSSTGSSNSVQYFVSASGNDANSGTQDNPWRTVQHASEMAQPGSIIHVAPGDYTEQIQSTNSGFPGSRIRFQSDVKWGARIRTQGSDISWVNEGDYVDIAGFDISGDGRIGILNNGSSVRIIGNHVHDIPASPCTDNGGAGIDQGDYTASDNDTIGNVVNNIGKAECNRVHAIYHNNIRGRVWNNVASGSKGWGISLWHAASDVQIANNLVFGNDSGGVFIGAGDAPGGVINENTLVTNNIVIFNKGIGIYEFKNTGPNQYVNNLVAQSGDSNISLLNGNKDVGTITALPAFINFRIDGKGDYHLATGSPGVDAGTALGAPTFDIDGLSRSQKSAIDLGPYAFGIQSRKIWPYQVPQ
jgi:hypothetical protein